MNRDRRRTPGSKPLRSISVQLLCMAPLFSSTLIACADAAPKGTGEPRQATTPDDTIVSNDSNESNRLNRAPREDRSQRESPSRPLITIDDTTVDEVAGHLGLIVPTMEADVSLAVTAKLKEIYVRLGDAVDADEMVAVFDPTEWLAQLRVAEAKLLTAQAEYRRAQRVLEQAASRAKRRRRAEHLLSREDVADADYASKRARAAKDTARGSLEVQQAEVTRIKEVLSSLELRAPFSGRVAARHANLGEVVQGGRPVLRLVSDSVLVRFAVPNEAFRGIAVGTFVNVELSSARSHTARVTRIAPEIDAAGLVIVEAEFEGEGAPNTSQLLGQSCRVHLRSAKR